MEKLKFYLKIMKSFLFLRGLKAIRLCLLLLVFLREKLGLALRVLGSILKGLGFWGLLMIKGVKRRTKDSRRRGRLRRFMTWKSMRLFCFRLIFVNNIVFLLFCFAILFCYFFLLFCFFILFFSKLILLGLKFMKLFFNLVIFY